MGMLTKLKTLSEQQHARQPSTPPPPQPDMKYRRRIPTHLLPLVIHHSRELMEEFLDRPDWRTTRYLGMIIVRGAPDESGAFTKLVTLDEGIAELKSFGAKNWIPFDGHIEGLLRGDPPQPIAQRYCFPLYVSTPEGGGIMFITTDGVQTRKSG